MDLRWGKQELRKPAKFFRFTENGFVLFYDIGMNLTGQYFNSTGSREFCLSMGMEEI